MSKLGYYCAHWTIVTNSCQHFYEMKIPYVTQCTHKNKFKYFNQFHVQYLVDVE